MLLYSIISSLPVVLAMDFVTRDLLTPSKQFGEGCGFDSCKSTRDDILNVHIVPHTHGELGFTADFYAHYSGDYGDGHGKTQVNMKRILDFTITELWADSERRFVLSDLAYFFYWWKQRDDTVHRMVYELIRQGRLQFVGGGISMTDEATTSYHAIIDMFTYSLGKLNASFLECGRPIVSWQSDVFGHTREFASLVSQMGFSGHFINPISYDDEVARMIAKALEFVWRGSDDLGASTDIYTHKLFDGYWSPPGFCFGSFCEDPLMVESNSLFRNIESRVKDFIKVAAHRQGPYYTTKNIMVIMGQRYGYFDAGVWFGNIDKLIKHVNEKSAAAGNPINLFYSTPACYLKAVSEARPELSTKQDDFLPFAYDQSSMAVGFYTSRPTLKYFVRQGHVYLQIAKQLLVTANLINDKKFDSLMEKFKWINGVMQDHNIITGVMPEATRSYYTQKMYLALQGSLYVDIAGLNKLRKSPPETLYLRCSFNISVCQNTDVDQYFIVIYNPLAWPVSIKVRLPSLKREFIVFHPSGKRVKAAIIRIAQPVFSIYRRRTHANHELVFIAEDVPAMGYRSYFILLKSLAWKRGKRALVKKVNRKTKKYLVRQAYQNIIDESPESFDYEYFEGPTPIPTTPKTKILFGGVESENARTSEQSSEYVVAPRAKIPYKEAFNKSANATKDDLLRYAALGEKYVSLESLETRNSNKTSNKSSVFKASRTRVLNKDNVNKSTSLTKDVHRYAALGEKYVSLESLEMKNSDINRISHKGSDVITPRTRVLNKNTVNKSTSLTNKNLHRYVALGEKDVSLDSPEMKNIVINRTSNKSSDVITPRTRVLNKDVSYKSAGLTKEDFHRYTALSENDIFISSESKKRNKSMININRTPTKDYHWEDFYKTDNKSFGNFETNDIYVNKSIDMSHEGRKSNQSAVNKTISLFNKTDEDIIEVIRKFYKNTKTNNNATTKNVAVKSKTNTSNGDDKKPKNTSVNEQMQFDKDDVVLWDNDKVRADNKKINKNKWKYNIDVNNIVNMTTAKIGNKTNKTSSEVEMPSDLKDSDFSDVKSSDEGKDNKTVSRKFNSIFGSDDEMMRSQMFAGDGDKSKKEDDENLKKLNFDTDDDKMKVLGSSEEKVNISKIDRPEGAEQDILIDSYNYIKMDDYFIRNKYVKVCIDKNKRLTNITLSNGINITFNAEMYFYESDDPKQFDSDAKQPGITMFRAMDPRPQLIYDAFKVEIYKNRIVQEMHYEFSSYASFVIRLYRRDPVIELEWQVGPVPIADNFGKEVFIRYTTNLKNEGTFYTDSNGRQTVKRIRNKRPTYEPMKPDYLAGNIYPVTSKIYIEDKAKNIRLSIFNDRSQGGTSLADGEIDLFIHRRILTDDTNRGTLTLNETEYGEGIRVRGKHYIYLTKADYKPNRIFEKKFAKEIELAPQIFVTKSGPYGGNSKKIWLKQTNEFSALNSKLPIGVHILTLEKWGEDGNDLLLRLENYLEKSDTIKNGVKKVKLKNLFVNIKITSIRETSLAGNMWHNHAASAKFDWNKKNKFFKNFNQAYGNEYYNVLDRTEHKEKFRGVDLEEGIVLVPQEIRTFFVTYEYVEN